MTQMGIPHFEDMTPTQLLAYVSEPWTFSEKFDGSFILAGVDETGRFYTERKGGQRYYDVEDWPNECWANGFKQAHAHLDLAFEQGKMPANESITFEILDCQRPNVIFYSHHMIADDEFVLVPHSENVKILTMGSWIFENEINTCSVKVLRTSDGLTANNQLEVKSLSNFFNFGVKHNVSNGTKDLMASMIREWLEANSQIEGLTRHELIELKLNRRPEQFTSEEWKKEKANIAAERDIARSIFKDQMRSMKKYLYHQMESKSRIMIEGFCVFLAADQSKPIFKIVNRDFFTPANKFVHRVKDALVGGSRPPRPSFLSRTANWPVEKRLARLEVLRKRYLANHHRLSRTFYDSYGERNHTIAYTDDLHQRMLMLFYDIRTRLIDGRASFQGQRKKDS